MEKTNNTDRIILALGLVSVAWYATWRFLGFPEKDPRLGKGAAPDSQDYAMSSILLQVMRDTRDIHTPATYFYDNRNFINSDEDIERLYNAFGVKPYDAGFYMYNLPDFLYPELDLLQWIHKNSTDEEIQYINNLWADLGIKYRV